MEKSISSSSAGARDAEASPSETVTGRITSMQRTGASSRRKPCSRIARTNPAAEPSRIGSSDPSTSTIAFSTPQPESAAIRCSTVDTETPASFTSIVQSAEGSTES